MKLTVINPVANLPRDVLDAMGPYLASLTRPDTQIETIGLTRGFPSIESDMQGMFNGVEVARAALAAVERGAQGVFVNCFDDPGVQALREMVDVPVFGGYVPSVLTAAGIGGRVGIITTDEAGVANEARKAATAGFSDVVRAVVSVDMMVGDIFGGEGVEKHLFDACIQLRESHRIDTVVLGCTGMQRAVFGLRRMLAEAGCPIEVVEPLGAGVTWLERIVALGHTNSLHTGLTLDGFVE